MPRRKKKMKETSEGQNVEKDLESSSCVSIRKKRRLDDSLIVISDSDGEETKEENGLQKTKTKQSNRSKCLAKRKIAQMSEEEQFALALKMSEQEAREVNNQEEKEEELLRKAIAESLNSSQGLFVEETSGEVPKSSEGDDSVPASQSIAALTSKRSLVLMPGSSAEEITVCPETQLSSLEPLGLHREDSPDGRELPIEVANRGDGKKETPPAVSSSARVPCPLCNQAFPPTKIEQHAMYCNGLVEQETVLTRRQREAKKKSDGRTAAQPALDTNRKEKCYLCKSLVPLGEYECHVEACLQLAKVDREDGTEGMRRPRVCAPVEGKQQQRLRKSNEKGHSEGRLLSLLEQSEHRTTGVEKKPKSSEARTFRMPSPEVEEGGCSREMQSSLSQLNLNESPIKSFVPVSEATNCLVDFKDQFAFRSRTKSGRGRRRKS
ncbi:BRCA1-A complex subunit RAP80 isoform X3 [Mastomys coucha]|uniref:BRCA1-A complex subunit RAP80 isoform X3 n=1 Tax=Mastomys coucha TaxID=35658 RepID=UPI0012622938|nr:BRCA1-A complex subunit RAP80 isoform X3 [Mastomys coucha]